MYNVTALSGAYHYLKRFEGKCVYVKQKACVGIYSVALALELAQRLIKFAVLYIITSRKCR